MTALGLEARTRSPSPGSGRARYGLRVEDLGELVPMGRPGGQGRVYRPARLPAALDGARLLVKIYRRPPSPASVRTLSDMVAWGGSLEPDVRARLHRISAWPLAIAARSEIPVGIAMQDLSSRFEIPFAMPSGRRERVLLSLEHLLGSDHYLLLRGLGVRLDTATRVRIAERISGALAFLHRHAIVAGDIAPNNLLVAFGNAGPEVCFIDCDSMVFRGRQALPAVETSDWQLPNGLAAASGTRAADAYKLGLIVLRLLARSHNARSLSAHARHMPVELHALLARALAPASANRPPAGEWQRSLRELLARGGLNHRYPGSPPRPRPQAAHRLLDVHPPSPRVHASAPRSPTPRSRGRQHPVTLVWVAVAAVMLWLVFARLLAAEAPAPNDTNVTPGSSQPNAPYYYQPAPPDDGR